MFWVRHVLILLGPPRCYRKQKLMKRGLLMPYETLRSSFWESHFTNLNWAEEQGLHFPWAQSESGICLHIYKQIYIYAHTHTYIYIFFFFFQILLSYFHRITLQVHLGEKRQVLNNCDTWLNKSLAGLISKEKVKRDGWEMRRPAVYKSGSSSSSREAEREECLNLKQTLRR